MTAPVLMVACLAWAGATTGSPFHNVRNVPFEAVCNGPQGAIVVEDGPGARATAATAEPRVQAAIRAQHNPRELRQAERALRFLQAHGVKSPRAELRFPRGIVHTQGGRLVTPDLDRVRAQLVPTLGDSANDLHFAYQGFNDADKATLQGYLSVAYPRAKQVYGPPAFDLNVKIIQDDTLHNIQGGTYDATSNEIRIPSLSGNTPEDTFVLMMLVLRAFHDETAIHFDAWEQGMTRAAATAVQTWPGVSPSYDPSYPGPFYAGSVYEAENQPQLGGSTFFPASGFTGMLTWRVSMAFAAWLKCWVEDPTFFSKFNHAYYSGYDTELPGDSGRLRLVAESVRPTVEGMPFQAWFRRQYALDTSVTIGPKLYVWNVPAGEAVILVGEQYVTEFTGDESPRGGRANVNFFSFDFTIDLLSDEGVNRFDLPATGDGAGEGALIATFTNIGAPQRITVRVTLNDLRGDYPFPYAERGFEAGENNLYGAIVGRTDGTVAVTGGLGPQSVSVSRGVWGVPVTLAALTPQQLVVSFTNLSGQTVTRTVNVMYDSYVVLLESGTESRVQHTFFKGATGLNFISLPLTPLSPDPAQVFGIDPQRLLLAHYNPRRTSAQKYELYPDVGAPRLGQGYFLKVFQDVTVDVPGLAPDPAATVEIPVDAGWNMVGNPFPVAVPEANLRVRRGTGTPVTLATAVTNGWLQAGIFHLAAGGGYELTDRLGAFEGQWIRVRLSAGLTLLVPGPGAQSTARSASVPAASSVTAPDWKLPVVVRQGDLVSSASYLGVSTRATAGPDASFDLTGPPAWGPYVSLSFSPGGVSEGAAYVTDVRPNAAGQEWTCEVRSSEAAGEAELSWPDLSHVPRNLSPVLVDLDAGVQRNMRATRSYPFQTAGPDASRHFAIKMNSTRGPLVISALSHAGGQGVATVVYTLSAPAGVTAAVRNIAGVPIRRLLTGQDAAAGTHELVWSLQDDRGLRVPSGTYLIELKAEAPDGQSTRRVARIEVQR